MSDEQRTYGPADHADLIARMRAERDVVAAGGNDARLADIQRLLDLAEALRDEILVAYLRCRDGSAQQAANADALGCADLAHQCRVMQAMAELAMEQLAGQQSRPS